MSRGIIRSARPYVVWLGVTGASAAAVHAVPGTWRAAAGASAPEAVPHVLVAACATGLALSLAWLWLVTSVTVAEVVTGSVPRRGGAARRLVLLACGAAVVAGTALPAQASGGDGVEVLVGLPLPERAVAPATVGPPGASATATAADRYVVRSGDSLWSIARAHPAPDTDVETRWRAIWRHNRDVVGDDPDLIHPGQALRLTDTDTERPGRTTRRTENDDEHTRQRRGRGRPPPTERRHRQRAGSAGPGPDAAHRSPAAAPAQHPRERPGRARARDPGAGGRLRRPLPAGRGRDRRRRPAGRPAPAPHGPGGRSTRCRAAPGRSPPPAASHRAGSGDPTRRGRSWSAYAPP